MEALQGRLWTGIGATHPTTGSRSVGPGRCMSRWREVVSRSWRRVRIELWPGRRRWDEQSGSSCVGQSAPILDA